jgi:hypothetical protein
MPFCIKPINFPWTLFRYTALYLTTLKRLWRLIRRLAIYNQYFQPLTDIVEARGENIF